MPDLSDEQRVQTFECDAGLAQEQPEADTVATEELPDEMFNERQRGMGEMRKEAGPPLEDEGSTAALTADEAEVPDVPPTDPDETAVEQD